MLVIATDGIVLYDVRPPGDLSRCPSDPRIPTPALLLDLDVLERNLSPHGRARPPRWAWPCARTSRPTSASRSPQRQRALGRPRHHRLDPRTRPGSSRTTGSTTSPGPSRSILSRLDEIRELAERITLRLVVDTKEAVQALEGLGLPLHVWIKVDCGYHRAGVDPESPEALELARSLAGSSRLTFDGILTHSGHAYHGREPRGGRRRIAEEERRVMAGFAERLRGEGIEVPEVSVGSTPAHVGRSSAWTASPRRGRATTRSTTSSRWCSARARPATAR